MAKKSAFSILYGKIPAPLRNKFLLSIVFFCLYLIFFDRNNIIAQWKLNQTEQEMIEKKEFYKEEMKVVEKETEALEDPEQAEKIAREKYMMKKENEDIFVIVEE